MVLERSFPPECRCERPAHGSRPWPASASVSALAAQWLAIAALGFSLSTVANAGELGPGIKRDASDSVVRVVAPAEETSLVVDAAHQAYVAKLGERSCAFRFVVMNASDREILINQVRTSCGCAVAQFPAQPWHLAAGASGTVLVTVDLRGMSGVVVRTATIDLPTTFKLLTMKITVPSAAKKSP